MQLVVLIAVRKAVSAATTTFTAISTIRFFIHLEFIFEHESHKSHEYKLRVAKIRVLTSLKSLTLGIVRIHSALHSLIREIRAIRGFNLSV